MDRFPVCQAITAVHEGTWSNHSEDPGGATMYGVTQAVYDAWRKSKGLAVTSVRYISKAEVLEIYRKNYWEACDAPNLFPGVDLSVYDAAVNSGVSRAKKWLTASVGSNDHSVTVKKICRARLSFMQSLKIWKTFGKGWGRRVADIEAKGVAMALLAMGSSAEQIKAAAFLEIAAANKSVKNSQNGEKAAATGAVGSGAAATTTYTDAAGGVDYVALALLGGVGVAIVLLLIWINTRKRAAKERADAYSSIALTGAEA